MTHKIVIDKHLINIPNVLKKIGLQKGERVADLGTGSNATWAIASARIVGDTGIVYAVDILKPVLEAVHTKASLEGLHNIKTVWSDLEVYGATKIPEGTLDMVYLINTLYKTSQPGKVLAESVRLLKSGGRLVVIDWKAAPQGFGPDEKHKMHIEEIERECLRLGLRPVQVFTPGDYHFGLLFQK